MSFGPAEERTNFIISDLVRERDELIDRVEELSDEVEALRDRVDSGRTERKLVITKYEQPFPVTLDTRIPKWDSKNPIVPINPPRLTWNGGPIPPNLADYDGYVYMHDDGFYHLAQVGPSFWAQLIPEAFDGGRSAANIRFRDINRGFSYLMPADAALKLIGEAMLNGESSVSGQFSIVKRGANYRLKSV